MSSSATDDGARAVAHVHARLMIDEEWTRWNDQGFSWIAHRLAQFVEAGRPRESRDCLVTPLQAWTSVVDEVTAPTDDVLAYLAWVNAGAVGSAYVFWPERRRVTAHAQHHVHAGTLEFRASEVADYAMLQLCEAEAVAEEFARQVGGAPAWREFPGTGPRPTPDEMLGVLDAAYLPAGDDGSSFDRPSELQAAATTLAQGGIALRGTGDGMWYADLPARHDDTCRILLAPVARHPRLGSGLGVRTSVVFEEADSVRGARLAARLQRQQLDTVQAGGGLGAWTAECDGTMTRVAWTRFVPNYNYRDGLVRDVAMAEVNRAVWLANLLWPDARGRAAGRG